MNIPRVDSIIQYTLTVASENDWGEQELKPIHLIKYVYLADLDYASRNQGETYTGINWQFFRFGPWSKEVNDRLEPALSIVGAQKKVIEHTNYKSIFWFFPKGKPVIDLERTFDDRLLPITIQGLVRKYGNETKALLHDVYKTLPMLHAAPFEILNFSRVIQEPGPPEKSQPSSEQTARQKKKRKAKLESIKKGFQKKMAQKKQELAQNQAERSKPCYDEVFWEGVQTLEKLAGEEIPPGRITCSFSDEFWKSKARYDPDLP